MTEHDGPAASTTVKHRDSARELRSMESRISPSWSRLPILLLTVPAQCEGRRSDLHSRCSLASGLLRIYRLAHCVSSLTGSCRWLVVVQPRMTTPRLKEKAIRAKGLPSIRWPLTQLGFTIPSPVDI